MNEQEKLLGSHIRIIQPKVVFRPRKDPDSVNPKHYDKLCLENEQLSKLHDELRALYNQIQASYRSTLDESNLKGKLLLNLENEKKELVAKIQCLEEKLLSHNQGMVRAKMDLLKADKLITEQRLQGALSEMQKLEKHNNSLLTRLHELMYSTTTNDQQLLAFEEQRKSLLEAKEKETGALRLEICELTAQNKQLEALNSHLRKDYEELNAKFCQAVVVLQKLTS